jgi:hypothetical protein
VKQSANSQVADRCRAQLPTVVVTGNSVAHYGLFQQKSVMSAWIRLCRRFSSHVRPLEFFPESGPCRALTNRRLNILLSCAMTVAVLALVEERKELCQLHWA